MRRHVLGRSQKHAQPLNHTTQMMEIFSQCLASFDILSTPAVIKSASCHVSAIMASLEFAKVKAAFNRRRPLDARAFATAMKLGFKGLLFRRFLAVGTMQSFR